MNLYKKFGDGGLRALYWEAATAGTVEVFEKALRKIKEMKREAYDYLVVLEPKAWSFHAMESSVKVEHITSNFVESFNFWMDNNRYMPPYKLLDELRAKLMETI